MDRAVIINSFEGFQEALTTRGTDFAGRPQNNVPISLVTRGNKTITAKDYSKKLVFLRKLAFKSMHLYGNGLNKIEKLIDNSFNHIVTLIKKENGKPLSIGTYYGKINQFIPLLFK